MKKLTGCIILLSMFLVNINISQAQRDHNKALIDAANNDDLERVEKLIKLGIADINAQNKKGWTPLIFASYQAYPRIVKVLIEAGADVNIKTKTGITPLIIVTSTSGANKVRPLVAKMLIDAGANVTAVDSEGHTAMYYANKHKRKNIIQLIERASNNVAGQPVKKEKKQETAKIPEVPKKQVEQKQVVQKTQVEQYKPKEKYQADLSFFSTQELKDMYKQAINNKDFENIDIMQKELAARAEASPTPTVAAKTTEPTVQYRGSGDPLKGLDVAKTGQPMIIGNYYALIIGIDNYKEAFTPLKNAVLDAKAVEDILREKFKIDHFRTLYNELATRKNIMRELSWLVDNVTENDNVFIYYSGHGEYNKKLNKGYWVPVEARTTETFEFISNSDIQTYLNGIKSKHTLLVSDACFSGDIFRGKTISVPFEQSTRYYNKVHNLKSRQAFTSGGVEPVMDGGSDGHSVFTYYFLEMLKRNEDKYYDTGQLYNDLKIPVTNNSEQSPMLQPVKNTGDEGGQFIFIKK
ncbi:MAG: caspase family protein [Bacteroidota bacterium]